MLAPWKKSYDQPRQHIKKQRYYFADKGQSNQSYDFSSSRIMDVRVSPWGKVSAKGLTLLNCGVGENSWEFLGLQDQTSQSSRKSVMNIHWKDWCWIWSSNTLVTWCKNLTHWKKILMLGKIEVRRRRERWRLRWLDASPTWWTWVWASSGRWWWTGKPSVGKESDMTEWLNWTERKHFHKKNALVSSRFEVVGTRCHHDSTELEQKI